MGSRAIRYGFSVTRRLVVALTLTLLSSPRQSKAESSAYAGVTKGIVSYQGGEQLGEIATPSPPGDLAVTEDGTLLFTSVDTEQRSPAIAVFDTLRRAHLGTVPTGEYVAGIATRPKTGVAYVAFPHPVFGESRVGVFDPNNLGLRSLFLGGLGVARPWALAFDRSGATLWVGLRAPTNPNVGRIERIDPDTGDVLGSLPLSFGVNVLVASEDGTRIYAGANEVLVIDGASLAIVHRVDVPAITMALTHDGHRLFYCGNASWSPTGPGAYITDIHVLDTRTFAETSFRVPGEFITDMAITADDAELYMTDARGGMSIVRLDSQPPVVTRSGLMGNTSVTVAPRPSTVFEETEPRAAEIRIGSVQGPVGAVVSVPITLRGRTDPVRRLVHELRTTGGAPFIFRGRHRLDCTINALAGVQGTFELIPPDCQYCDRIAAHLEIGPEADHNEVELYTCNLRLSPSHPGSYPLASGYVTAWNENGAEIPAIAFDGHVLVGRTSQASPRPTLTSTPTVSEAQTPTISPTPVPPTPTTEPTSSKGSANSGCALTQDSNPTALALALLVLSTRRARR